MTTRRAALRPAAWWFFAIAALAATASAQVKPGKGPAEKHPATTAPAAPKGTAPASPGSGTKPDVPGDTSGPGFAERRPEPTVGPYVTRGKARDLQLTVHVRLNASLSDDTKTMSDGYHQVQMPDPKEFTFEQLAVVWPVVSSTSSATCNQDTVTGKLSLDDRVVDDSPKLLGGLYHSGVKLARWDASEEARKMSAKEVELEVVAPASCSKVQFDEEKALRVGWPKGPWPAEAALTFGTQMFVDSGPKPQGQADPYEAAPLDAVLKEIWAANKIEGAKSVPPVRTAKMITRWVWENIQPSDDGLTNHPRTGELAGIALQGPAKTVSLRKGSPHDMAALLVALMRKAGLPTRSVIGFDGGAGGAKFLKDAKKANRLRSWCEFCLYDEDKNTVNWVVIDIARLRDGTTRPPGLERPWKYFGSHDELEDVVPFALQFHPPTDVVAYGSPGFWGWYVQPTAPTRAAQALRFEVTLASKRGDQDPRVQKDAKKVGHEEKKHEVKRGGG